MSYLSLQARAVRDFLITSRDVTPAQRYMSRFQTFSSSSPRIEKKKKSGLKQKISTCSLMKVTSND